MKRPYGLALLAVVILVVFGGSLATVAVRTSHQSGPRAGGAPTAPATTTGAGSTPATGPGSSSPASTVVDPAVFVPPSGWQQVPDAAAGTGAVDVSSAAALDGGGAPSADALRQLGYVRGTTRQWRNPTEQGLVMVDLVYSFASASGAQGYASTAVRTRSASADFTPASAPAGSPAGAQYFTGATGSGRVLVVIYAAGSRAVVLGLVRNGTAPSALELSGLAARQASAALAAPTATPAGSSSPAASSPVVGSPATSSPATSSPAAGGSSSPVG